MYNLIIVDDEIEVRRGIIKKIEWEKFGFQVAGEAENGREALDIIERDIPDVVITDIRMPIMDGLELASIIRDKFPTVRIIILTGFDDFKYAQQAIKLDIVEYVLKPVTSKDMMEILKKLRNQLDEERAQREDLKALKEHYIQSMPVMKDRFLTSLITSKKKKDDIDDKCKAYSIRLSGTNFTVGVISLDFNSIKAGSFRSEERDLAVYAIQNISEEIVGKHSLGHVFTYNDLVTVLFSFGAENQDFVLNRVFSALNEIRINVEKYLKFTVTIGIGSITGDITAVGDSYRSAVAALDYRFVIGTNRVIFIEDLEQKYVEKVEFDEVKEQLLKTSIKVGTEEDISNTVDMLFKDIGDMKASFKDYQIYLLEILAAITKLAKSLQLDTGEILGSNSNFLTELYKFETIEAVKQWIKKICTGLMMSIDIKRKDNCKLLVEKAKDYVAANYSEEDLTINKMCSILHISVSYFTSIFKKETGETFLNYLVRTRLEAAMEMLVSTGMKTSEIAQKVGYPDPHYFSYFFKKNYGTSPKEYRNQFSRKSGEM